MNIIFDLVSFGMNPKILAMNNYDMVIELECSHAWLNEHRAWFMPFHGAQIVIQYYTSESRGVVCNVGIFPLIDA